MALTVKITNGSGTTDFTCGTIRFSQRSATPVLINGFTVAYQWNYVVEGELINTSTSSVMSDITAFESLVGTMSKIEFDDSSGNVQHSIAEINTLTGLQRSLSWLGSDLHLATEAKFQLSLQFMLANTNEEATLLEVSESITIQGEGGAATPLVPKARSAWVYQQTMQYTPVYVVQSGYVVYKGHIDGYVAVVRRDDDKREATAGNKDRDVLHVRTGMDQGDEGQLSVCVPSGDVSGECDHTGVYSVVCFVRGMLWIMKSVHQQKS